MPRRKVLLLLLIPFLLAGNSSSAATTVRTLIGENIPARLKIEAPFVFNHSDTVSLNGRVLVAGEEYSFRQGEGFFDFSGLNPAPRDTFVIKYTPVPRWMVRSYGRDLPRAAGTRERPEIPAVEYSERPTRLPLSDIKLSGAKSFRFSARSTGGSEFGQSLDLNISGELSPGLTLTGSVSDRGYDPAYGTANSRLNELDKINLTLQSNRLRAQVGDITVDPGRTGSGSGKSVSGASFQLNYPHWGVTGTAARPRGVYASTEFTGQDGFQGPYRIDNGSTARSVVPGSETVWLDGLKMEPGANKDYTIDYPTGRVTFTVNRPIDSRSRIEVDFEPLATAYKEELLGAGASAQLKDSALYLAVEALREGEDKEQPLIGELSNAEKNLLAAAGDSTAYRSGVTPDTSGSYTLVVDSLPDSVYQYVGRGNGAYTVIFSFVGSENGGYRFVGSDQYEYIGAGKGDYAPVVILPIASRNDYYAATLGSHTRALGDLSLDVRESNWDRNLWSSLDDGDNAARYYRLQAARQWRWQGRENSYQVFRRVREFGFRNRERINRSDFRRQYFFPGGFVASSDEALQEASVNLTPLSSLRLSGMFGLLEYYRSFDSRTGKAAAEWRLTERGRLSASWLGIATHLDNASLSGDGNAENFSLGALYRVMPNVAITTELERDRRRHKYTDVERGTRYDRAEVAALVGQKSDEAGLYGPVSNSERVAWEYYVEDSLTGDWSQVLRRNRLSGSSTRRLGDLSYNATLSYQWLKRPQEDENSFLGRADFRYSSTRHRLTVNTAYTISEERRNERGLTYLEVEPGIGNFIKENGVYIPDPDGNYIQVEEILSDAARVRRAQKSFYLSKRWSLWQLRFDSEIEEELKESGERKVWWAVPFLTDASQPYLYFARRYNGVLRILPIQGFYALNLLVAEDAESREISGSPRQRRDRSGRITLKQVIAQSFFEEALELFKYDRDVYFTGSGNVKGYEVSLGLRQLTSGAEISGGGSFRRADSDADERSDILALTVGSRMAVFERGEFRTSLELYRQTLTNVTGSPSYQLTGNRPGTKGAVWSTSLNYGVKGGVRVNFSVTGRHSDDRTARLTGRGEVVAAF